jgi:hypothetical protein
MHHPYFMDLPIEEPEPIDEDKLTQQIIQDTIAEQAEPDITAWAKLEALLRKLIGGE